QEAAKRKHTITNRPADSCDNLHNFAGPNNASQSCRNTKNWNAASVTLWQIGKDALEARGSMREHRKCIAIVILSTGVNHWDGGIHAVFVDQLPRISRISALYYNIKAT